MGTPSSRRNKKNSPPSWQSFFLPPATPPPFIPVSPIEFLSLSPFLLRYPCLTFVVALHKGSPLFSFVLRFFFAAFTPTPVCLPLAAAISFVVRFLAFHRCADDVRFFLGGARLTIGQGANSNTLQPFWIRVTPRSVGCT